MRTSSENGSLFIAARGLATILLLSAAACGDPSLPQPAEPELQFSSSAFPAPLECPTNEPLSATGTIGGAGGTVSAGGHSITLPVGAVGRPTEITLSAPVSNYMEIDIRAGGRSDFRFKSPVSITISYDRCTRSNIEKGPLSAWFWDASTKTLLEDMAATDDRDNRRVRFSTDHLSGYIVAN